MESMESKTKITENPMFNLFLGFLCLIIIAVSAVWTLSAKTEASLIVNPQIKTSQVTTPPPKNSTTTTRKVATEGDWVSNLRAEIKRLDTLSQLDVRDEIMAIYTVMNAHHAVPPDLGITWEHMDSLFHRHDPNWDPNRTYAVVPKKPPRMGPYNF